MRRLLAGRTARACSGSRRYAVQRNQANARLLCLLLLLASIAGPAFAQAPTIYIVPQPYPQYWWLHYQGDRGPNGPWPSFSFAAGSAASGISVTSALGANGVTIALLLAATSESLALHQRDRWQSFGSIDVYVRGGPGTGYRLDWNCTQAVSATATSGSSSVSGLSFGTCGGISVANPGTPEIPGTVQRPAARRLPPSSWRVRSSPVSARTRQRATCRRCGSVLRRSCTSCSRCGSSSACSRT
jgi:hypothetical protein